MSDTNEKSATCACVCHTWNGGTWSGRCFACCHAPPPSATCDVHNEACGHVPMPRPVSVYAKGGHNAGSTSDADRAPEPPSADGEAGKDDAKMDADDLTIKALRAEVDFRAVTIEGLLKQRDEAEAEVERLKEAMGNGWPLIEKERARVAELTRERGITDGAFQKFRDESYAREAKGGLIRTGLEEKCKRLEGALREITEQNDYAEYHSLCIARRALADEEGKK